MKKVIYFDNASTTSLNSRVLDKMLPYLKDVYGNANSSHQLGRLAVSGLDEAREIVSSCLNAKFNEIYFTSGGTESDNWVLRGMAKLKGDKNKLVLSSIEHSAMLKTSLSLKADGVDVVYVNPDKNGMVDAEEFASYASDAFLCSLMYANNEVGTIQPIKKVASLVHEKGSYFYSDGVQAMSTIKVDVKDLGVDAFGFSAHKFNGPKGVGCLYLKSGTPITSLISGGFQERSLRGGTSNVAGAIGLAYALKFNRESLEKDSLYVKGLRDYFIDKVLKVISGAKLNGSIDNRLNNNANICFDGVDGTALLNVLDLNGICASLGAACSVGSVEPSHVLLAMGLSEKEAFSSIRFTFSKDNDVSEIDYVIEILKNSVEKLKNIN